MNWENRYAQEGDAIEVQDGVETYVLATHPYGDSIKDIAREFARTYDHNYDHNEESEDVDCTITNLKRGNSLNFRITDKGKVRW